jgi:cell division protein FtsI (penicillin-binding protein 3)
MSRRTQPKKNAPTPTRAKPRPTNTRVRLYVVMMMLALGSTALIVRAVDLQVVRKDFYQEQGDARFLREMPIPVSRGTIFDRNGEPLAVSTPVESIWANPQQLLEQPDRLPALAAALGIDAAALKEKLEQHQDKEFVYLKRQLNPDDSEVITKLGIAGVSAQREYKRYYPSGEVLAHILGVTNVDDRGQEGLELAFDDWLAGTPGAEHVIRDNKGHTVEDVELLREPKPGRNLTLSIDRRIQYMAYRELKSAIMEHHAMSGSIVVLDVQTGEILAMVNQPSFNPNAHGNGDISYRRNRAMTDVVEPGSTIKAFTMATALESGKWTLKSHVDTNPGYYQIGTWTIHDVKNHGLLDLTGVITKSSNIGAAKIAETLSRDSLYDMFHRFGFGESTGSGFPGESSGLLPVVTTWGPVEKATIS